MKLGEPSKIQVLPFLLVGLMTTLVSPIFHSLLFSNTLKDRKLVYSLYNLIVTLTMKSAFGFVTFNIILVFVLLGSFRPSKGSKHFNLGLKFFNPFPEAVLEASERHAKRKVGDLGSKDAHYDYPYIHEGYGIVVEDDYGYEYVYRSSNEETCTSVNDTDEKEYIHGSSDEGGVCIEVVTSEKENLLDTSVFGKSYEDYDFLKKRCEDLISRMHGEWKAERLKESDTS